jgi:integrase/recombinase XerD
MQPVLILMRELGMRVSEAVNLTAQQIDWERHVIVLKAEHTKTKKVRLLPINQVIESPLKGVTPGKDGRLFWHNGKPLNRPHLHDFFQVRCRQLVIHGLWVHDLRGTFATDALERGYDRALVRKITGHASDAAFDRYVRPKLDSLRKVVDRPDRETVH